MQVVSCILALFAADCNKMMQPDCTLLKLTSSSRRVSYKEQVVMFDLSCFGSNGSQLRHTFAHYWILLCCEVLKGVATSKEISDYG